MPWWPRSKDSSKKSNKAASTGGLYDGSSHQQQRRRGPWPSQQENSRHSVDLVSDTGSGSGKGSRSPSPSSPHNSNRRGHHHHSRGAAGQPLPLPCAPLIKTHSAGQLPGNHTQTQVPLQLHHAPSLPLPSPIQQLTRMESATEVDFPSGSVSSVSSLGSIEVDPRQQARVSNLRPSLEPEPELLRPVSQLGPGAAIPRGRVARPAHDPAGRVEPSRSTSPLPGSHQQQPATSPPSRVWSPIWHGGEGLYAAPLKIPPQADSSMSSPAPSPRTRLQVQQQQQAVVSGSASPRSGNTSTYSSWQGDAAPPWPPSQQYEDRSPSPSPRLTSPGPSSRTSPLHPRAGIRTSGGPDSPTTWHDSDGQGRSPHAPKPLPLPPLPTGNSSPYNSPPLTSGPSTPTMLSRHPSSNAMERSRSVESPVADPTTSTRWQKGRLLGSGTFGNVYVGFNNDNGGFCAMKEVLLVTDDHKSIESVKQLGQEINLLSKLSHPNIVQYIGTETLEDRLYIYLEYVSGGSIHKILQEYGAFQEPVVRRYTRQILCGLAYLHNQNTVHRDIKGANILVDSVGVVKLADFGMAKHVSAQSFLQSFKGSPYWMAPEVIKQGGYDLAVDIWSLGCTVLEMVTTKPPWHQYEGVAAMFKIGNSKELPAIPDSLSREGREFVRLCLQRDPANRPTAARLLEHPFVANADTSLGGADLPPTIRPVKVSSNMGHRPSTVHENEGGNSTRGRISHSPTSDLSPRAHGPPVQPKSPRGVHQVYSGMSTPMMSSGSSTPPGGGGGGYGMQYGNQNNSNNGSRTQSGRYASPCTNNRNGGVVYPEPRKDFYWSTPPQQRTPEGSPRRSRNPSGNVDNNILDYALGRMTVEEDVVIPYHGNGNIFGEHLHPSSRLPGSSHHSPTLLSRTNSHEYGRQW